METSGSVFHRGWFSLSESGFVCFSAQCDTDSLPVKIFIDFFYQHLDKFTAFPPFVTHLSRNLFAVSHELILYKVRWFWGHRAVRMDSRSVWGVTRLLTGTARWRWGGRVALVNDVVVLQQSIILSFSVFPTWHIRWYMAAGYTGCLISEQSIWVFFLQTAAHAPFPPLQCSCK